MYPTFVKRWTLKIHRTYAVRFISRYRKPFTIFNLLPRFHVKIFKNPFRLTNDYTCSLARILSYSKATASIRTINSKEKRSFHYKTTRRSKKIRNVFAISNYIQQIFVSNITLLFLIYFFNY